MRSLIGFLLLMVATQAARLDAQRRLRLGPTLHTIAVENGTGASRDYTAFGGALALLTRDDAETGLTVVRYGDLSDNACVREMTLYALDSYYYPVGARGLAPFAAVQVGLARVTESDAPLLFSCVPSTPRSTTNEIALAYGLGLRVGTANLAALVEGRFLQVPHSFIQGLEGRAAVALAFGSERQTELLAGTLGPVASVLLPVNGPLRARSPFVGVRFRRDTRKNAVLGLQVDYAPLEVTESCTAQCEPVAILFAPAYEPSLHPRWGRFYAALGPLLAGVPSEGPDRGISQGLHGGLGADLYQGAVMWTLSARLLWLQRNTGENVFGAQLGVGVSPKLVRAVVERDTRP
jgi:hypothetical protein